MSDDEKGYKFKGANPLNQNRVSLPDADESMYGKPIEKRLSKRKTEVIEVPIPVLALDEQGTAPIGRFTATIKGIELPDDVTREEWIALGESLMGVESAVLWCLADWLAYGDDHAWGKTYIEIANRHNVKSDTLYHYASVARKVKIWIRNPELSISHHRLVTKLTPEMQTHWLNLAVENGWIVEEMRLAIKAAGKSGDDDATSLLSDRDVRIASSLAQIRDAFNIVEKKWSRGGELLIDKISQIEALLNELKSLSSEDV